MESTLNEDKDAVTTPTGESNSLLAKKLRDELPEDVRAALDSMERVQRIRKTTPTREIRTYRYFEVG